MAKARVVHFMNHFFAGVGGEEKADLPLEVKDGPLGPGQGLQAQLGDNAMIVATMYCGDNYYPEHIKAAREKVLAVLKDVKADIVIAGPAFGAGRYGQACADAVQVASETLGIPGVMGLSPENAGLVFYRAFKDLRVYAIPTSESAAGMKDALAKMGALARRLAAGEIVGSAKAEGYIPRGIRVNVKASAPGIDRAVEMLVAKLNGKPFETEIPIITIDQVEPAPSIRDITKAKIALATTAGIQTIGNPQKMPSRNTDRWAKYNIEGLSSLEKGKWEMIHGIHSAFGTANPNIMAPLDVLRAMEDAGQIGAVHSNFYSLSGFGAQVSHAKRIGEEIATDMKSSGVDGVLLVST